jgi:predicted nucleotidyltransferase
MSNQQRCREERPVKGKEQWVSQKLAYILSTLKTLNIAVGTEYHAEIIGVFGSYARNEQQEESDVDILVKFFDGATLFDFAELAAFLEEELHLKVDLVSERALREELRDPILQEVVHV